MKLNHKIGAAVAVAMGLASGIAQAADLDTAFTAFVAGPPAVPPSVSSPASGPVTTYSQQFQFLTGSSAVTELPTIYVELEADYGEDDTIALNILGATVGGSTATKLNQNPPAISGTGIHCINTDGTNDPIIVSYVPGASSGNTIGLRVTNKSVLNTQGVVCSIKGIDVTDPSIAVLTNVQATWTASLDSGGVLESGNTLTVARVIDQFTSTVATALNGIVDVNSPSLRTAFLLDDDGAVAGNQDQLVVAVNDFAATITGAATTALINTVKTVLTGQFFYLDTDGDGVCEGGEGVPTAVASAGPAPTVAVASNCQSVTLTQTINQAPPPPANPGFVARTYTLAFSSNGAPAKEITAPQIFSAATTFNYDIGGAANSDDVDSYGAGEWTLNGFSAFVGYMPYGANISQIVYLTNKSDQEGEISVVGYNDAGVVCPSTNFSAGTIAGRRVKSLGTALLAGFESCYGAGFTGKVSFNVIANFPSALGELYSAYNVGGSDRGTVVNTSNGRVTAGGNSTTGGSL